MQILFGRQSDQARSKEVSTERAVNCFVDVEEDGAKNKFILYGTPGLDLFSAISTGRIRGASKLGNDALIVSGSTLYKVDSLGVTTSLGTISGSGQVYMARVGSNVSLVTRDTNDGYVSDGVTLAQITDPDWPTASHVTSLDGYAIYVRPDTGQFFISALLAPGDIDALDFATAESSPDNLLAVHVDHRDLLLFGEETIEVWFNSGNADFPFERRSGIIIERGCHDAGSIAKDDNSTLWLGDDLIIYRLTQFTPVRVSNSKVEADIAACRECDFEAWTYTYQSHKFYVLSFGSHTWVYDMLTGVWHERQSFGKGRWRAAHHVMAFNKDIVGDFETGNLYSLNMDTYTENGETIERITRTPPIHAYPARISMASLTVDMEGGVGLTTGQGSVPQAMLRWSNDGGNTWSNELWREIGRLGEYSARVKWTRLGSFRERVFELKVSDPVKFVLIGADAQAEGRAA